MYLWPVLTSTSLAEARGFSGTTRLGLEVVRSKSRQLRVLKASSLWKRRCLVSRQTVSYYTRLTQNPEHQVLTSSLEQANLLPFIHSIPEVDVSKSPAAEEIYKLLLFLAQQNKSVN